MTVLVISQLRPQWERNAVVLKLFYVCTSSFPLSDLWEVFKGSSAGKGYEAEANKKVQGLNNGVIIPQI